MNVHCGVLCYGPGSVRCSNMILSDNSGAVSLCKLFDAVESEPSD